MRWCALLWLVTACAGAPAPTAQRAPSPHRDGPRGGAHAAPGGEDPRAGAHAALVRHCGECHRGGHAGAPAEALAAFDLDRPDWAERFDPRRFEVALQRFAGKPSADRTAFLAFRDAELARR